MTSRSRKRYGFGPFELDAHDRLLTCQGEVVPLTPKALDTLLILVESGGHVVTKDELIERVWPDSFVEQNNLAQNISALRKALVGVAPTGTVQIGTGKATPTRITIERTTGVQRATSPRTKSVSSKGDISRGSSPSDVTIIEAISRFRAGGYDEQIGFTVYDTLRYKTALEELVSQEVDMVMNRLAAEVSPERVIEMLESGAEPLRDLIAALHTKLLVAELERQRSARG